MKRYFITGTDTDCGKTYVTSQLINYYSHAVAIKPIASGCFQVEDQWVSSDAQQLVNKNKLHCNLINPWRFQMAVSPHIAAQKQGTTIDLNEVAEYCLNFYLPEIETLFIEGAGGILVPLNEEHTWIDFLKKTKIPAILVVGMKLGCINHALLSYFALKTHGIECVGWIANCITPHMLAFEENIATLTRFMQVPLLATVTHKGSIEIQQSSWFRYQKV
jgi:dethiobiotin synthetase